MNEEFIKEAIAEANKNAENGFRDGGPFGAVVVKDGKIIARGHNTVLKSVDPSAHAEVNAIREAAKVLVTHDLSGCTLYASAEPCPMCLSTIIWANIKTVYYANTKEDSAKIGFRDEMIYDFIKSDNSDTKVLDAKHIDTEDAIKTFEKFENCKDDVLY